MSQNSIEQGVNRRGFLKSVAATALAATAAGTGAAYLLDRNQSGPVVVPPSSLPPAPEPVQAAISTGQDPSELLSRLAAAQAENVRLQAQLEAAQRRLEAAQSVQPVEAVAGEKNSLIEALQLQLDEANAQVGILSGQAAALSGLVALYEQLDAVDVSGVVSGGLASVGGVLGGLVDDLPDVTEGLQSGQQALSQFEAEIPLVDNGRRWLSDQLDKVSAYYEAVEQALQNAVEAAGSFLQMLSQWFQDVLKWLPFGIGDKAAQVMEAMTNLLAETPHTISGLQTNLVQPLDAWLEKEGEETHLHRRLIKPVREQALNRASQAISQVQTVQTTYQAQLAEPAEVTISEQHKIRNMIAEYRQKHQI